MNRKTFLCIEELLEGYSEGEVARIVGVDLAVIRAVIDCRVTYESCGPPERCPGCGGLVYMPCIGCASVSVAQSGLSLATV